MKLLYKFLKLPYQIKQFLLISLLIVVIVRLGLSTVRYNRLCRMIPRATATAPVELLAVVGWCVPLAAKYVFGASCLTQALAAKLILARKGYAAEIRIGARRDVRGRFMAHAWLLSNNIVVLGGSQAEVDTYSTFGNFSASSQ